MNNNLTKRLNAILPKITSADFLSGEGIGNEVPFYIFDYLPEDEISIRKHIAFIKKKLPMHAPDLKLVHVNLLDFLIEYITSRGYFEKSLASEQQMGSSQAVKKMKSISSAKKLADYFTKTVMSQQPDLILVSGVGSAYPIVRTHELLSNLQSPACSTPLVLFYPGVYDRVTLRLFGKASLAFDSSSSDHQRKNGYYRAFRLID